MATKERIKQVVEIVKKFGRLQRNQLMKIIEQEDLMSHQTANDAINEAVKFHKLYRQEDYKGKQKIVWYSINEDVRKAEELCKQELDKIIKNYDLKFLIFKEKYPKLTLQEKAEGIDAFSYLFRNIVEIIEFVHELFGQTTYWKKLLKEVRETGMVELQKLNSTESIKDLGHIALDLLSSRLEDVNDAFENVEEYLKELKD